MNIEIPNQLKKTAHIIGGGPAGLTVAYELLTRTDIKPIVYEANPEYLGGISKTVQFKGNRIDIGGHRFFSKSDRVMDWWASMMPIEAHDKVTLAYQGKKKELEANQSDPDQTDDIMLVRSRLSRIYYNKQLFPYPITLSFDVVKKLGLLKMIKIGVTYGFRLIVKRKERSLEDFFINRFGDELYLTFFKSYTEKVWGKRCDEIDASWGAQRIKGLSILKTLQHALTKAFQSKDISQKDTETSLIEWFLYPKFGPGHMWDVVATKIEEMGGEIHKSSKIDKLTLENDTITHLSGKNGKGNISIDNPDYVFSTMPIKDLSEALGISSTAMTLAKDLEYRDFITAGLLIKKSPNSRISDLKDNWIYVHEPGVNVGRVQIFNNWSPYMVEDLENTVWIGLEFFSNEGDQLWNMSDDDFKEMAKTEVDQIGLADKNDIIDAVVIKERKAYPSYTGVYDQFDTIRQELDSIDNLFLLGRNGMHRYNNQDHSMLTAMQAVDMISEGNIKKSEIWDVNTEQEYHEKK